MIAYVEVIVDLIRDSTASKLVLMLQHMFFLRVDHYRQKWH